MSVYIPIKTINEDKANFLQILKMISSEVIRTKQVMIERLAPLLQYTVIPERYRGDQGVWQPPFRDAAGVIIDRILHPATIEPTTGYTNEEFVALVLQQDKIMSEHEDYAALRGYNTTNKLKQISQVSKGLSIIQTVDTIRYPPFESIALSSSFIPERILRDKRIVEYQVRNGYENITYLS